MRRLGLLLGMGSTDPIHIQIAALIEDAKMTTKQQHSVMDADKIAMFPELVEALRTLAELCAERGLYPLNVDDALRVIAKAEGRLVK
jgi:hypothetical protein